MNFNNFVKTLLGPTFTENSFVLSEEWKNHMEFKNSKKKLTLTIGLYAFGGNEMVITLSMGTEDFDIEDILGLYEKPEHLPIFLRDEEMAKESLKTLKNILLRNNGELLKGDKECLAKLTIIRDKMTKEYNDKRDLEYLTSQVNNAWNDKDYLKFIKLVEPNKDKFQGSFTKKLEIAKRISKK